YAERRPILAAVNPIFWDEIARHNFEPKTGPLKEALEQLEALDQKHNALEQTVLAGLSQGNEAEERLRKQQDWEQQFGHLDPELRQRAIELQEAYERKRDELRADHFDDRGGITAAGRKARSEFAAEHRRALQELMGPEGALEWQLRATGDANWANNLRGFEASPE